MAALRRRSSCGTRGRSAAAGSLSTSRRCSRRTPRSSSQTFSSPSSSRRRRPRATPPRSTCSYLATALGHVALIVVASVSFAWLRPRVALLHRNVVAKLMHAPLSWYDSTPSGRTMSRFTTDVSQVDLQLSLELDNTFQMSSSLLMLCGLVAARVR